ncbi:MAG: sodium:solute symporter family protein [Bacteroidota bacterium]|nr:sodium:solute symporter family protein [Bacteroidota bacterium]
MTTQTAILIGLVIYALLMTAISLFFMARVKRAADYLVGGRGIPYWALTGNIVGTCIGTGVVIGASGLAYRHGWAGCAYPIGLGLGTLLTGLLYAMMRRYKFMTLGEEIACYYGKNRAVMEFSNISLFLSQLCWLTVQIMGGGAVLSVVTGWDPKICAVLAGAVTAVISIPGGLKTVIYTDFLQATILLCGFSLLSYVALNDVGGLAGLRQSVPSEYFSFLGFRSYGGWKIASLIIVLMLNPIADPGRRLTMYSARSETGARWSMVTAGIIVMVFSVVVGIAGMYTFKLNPNLPSSDQALPWLVMNVLPAWLAAVVVVSVVSAIFSSANGNAAAAGTFFVRHIFPLLTQHYPKQPVVAVRRALAAAFVLSTALALYMGNIVEFVIKFLPLTMSGLAVIILMGRFWKRSTWQGALAALITTPSVSLALMTVPTGTKFWDNPVIPATLIGVIALIAVSLFTPANLHSFEGISETMRAERDSIESGLSENAESLSVSEVV